MHYHPNTACQKNEDWHTAESSSQASAAEQFQHVSFGERRLSNLGFASHIESFQLVRFDPSQRTITFNIDAAACKTVVLARHPAALGYPIQKDSLLRCAYSMTKERESYARWMDQESRSSLRVEKSTADDR